MKNLATVLLLLVVGCTIHQDPSLDGEEIDFNVELLGGSSVTKGAQGIDASLVEDVNLYIFNAAGEQLLHNYFFQGNVQIEDFLSFSKERYSVYLLVNWGGELKVGSLDELKKVRFVPDNLETFADSAPLMTGVLEDVHLYDGAHIEVGLSKVYAGVNLKCNMSGLNYGVTVNVVRASLKNVPEESFLFEENVAGSVVDGKVLEGDLLGSIKGDGVHFYMLENLQGSVPGALDNKDKALKLTQQRRQLCSYVELECDLVSASHRGRMVYRFYLGSGHDNCNVARNTWQEIEVRFKGNASEDENSVSVDNSALKDRVKQVLVSPALIIFAPGAGNTYNLSVEIKPPTAFDKRVKWTTSNKNVVKVDNNGVITTVGSGQCKVYAISLDNQSVSGYVDIRVM